MKKKHRVVALMSVLAAISGAGSVYAVRNKAKSSNDLIGQKRQNNSERSKRRNKHGKAKSEV